MQMEIKNLAKMFSFGDFHDLPVIPFTGISTVTRVPVSTFSGYKSSIVTLKSVFRSWLMMRSLSSTIPIPRDVLPGMVLLCASDCFRPMPSSSTTQLNEPGFSVKILIFTNPFRLSSPRTPCQMAFSIKGCTIPGNTI